MSGFSKLMRARLAGLEPATSGVLIVTNCNKYTDYLFGSPFFGPREYERRNDSGFTLALFFTRQILVSLNKVLKFVPYRVPIRKFIQHSQITSRDNAE